MIPTVSRSIQKYDTAPPDVLRLEVETQPKVELKEPGTELTASRVRGCAGFALVSTTVLGSEHALSNVPVRENTPIVFVVTGSGFGAVNYTASPTTGERWRLDLDDLAGGLVLLPIDSDAIGITTPSLSRLVDYQPLPMPIEAVLKEFADGVGGRAPSRPTLHAARRIATEATKCTKNPDLTVDVDGALSFDMRAMDGRIVFAEMDTDGQLDVGVYSESGQMLDHNPQATEATFFAAIKPDAGTR